MVAHVITSKMTIWATNFYPKSAEEGKKENKNQENKRANQVSLQKAPKNQPSEKIKG